MDFGAQRAQFCRFSGVADMAKVSRELSNSQLWKQTASIGVGLSDSFLPRKTLIDNPTPMEAKTVQNGLHRGGVAQNLNFTSQNHYLTTPPQWRPKTASIGVGLSDSGFAR